MNSTNNAPMTPLKIKNPVCPGAPQKENKNYTVNAFIANAETNVVTPEQKRKSCDCPDAPKKK